MTGADTKIQLSNTLAKRTLSQLPVTRSHIDYRAGELREILQRKQYKHIPLNQDALNIYTVKLS